MNTAERAAWIQAARITGERTRQRQLMAESRARGWGLAVKQLIAEDQQRQSEVNARRLAEWAQSLPQPPAKPKRIPMLDYMSTVG